MQRQQLVSRLTCAIHVENVYVFCKYLHRCIVRSSMSHRTDIYLLANTTNEGCAPL